jgi:hypothetical protein
MITSLAASEEDNLSLRTVGTGQGYCKNRYWPGEWRVRCKKS